VLCDIYAFETRELLVTVERCMLWSWHDSTLMDRDGCGARVCVRIILFEILIQNARARESDYALWHRELIVNTWPESGRVRTFKFRVLAFSARSPSGGTRAPRSPHPPQCGSRSGSAAPEHVGSSN
jgi:hypothetical protein